MTIIFKIKSLLATVGCLSLLFLLPLIGFAQLATAQESLNIVGSLKCGTEAQYDPVSNSCSSPAGQTADITGIVKKVINIMSWAVGVVSVIMIIIAGFKYVTSGGSEKNVADAKSTILYAIVGLVVVALAQTIVRFVLSNVAGSNNTSGL